MAQIQELLVRYKGDTKGLKAATKDAERAVTGFSKKAEVSGNKVTKSFNTMRLAMASVAGVAVAQFGKSVVNTALEMEKLEAIMISAVGATGDVAGEMDRLRRLSNDLGLEFTSTAKTFAQFAAAARTSGLDMNVVRDVFDQTAKAGRAMNLSVADMNGVFTALTQIAGKGVVSMEEMRQQLGERVPIAMAAMADGLGITIGELTKLISSGQLAADTGLKALADGFRNNTDLASSFAASSNSTTAEINRMKNALTEFKQVLAESGFIAAFTAAVKALGVVFLETGKHIKNTVTLLKVFRETIAQGTITITKKMTEGAIKTGKAFGFNTTQLEQNLIVLKEAQQQAAINTDSLIKYGEATDKVTTATTNLTTKMNEAGGRMEVLTDKTKQAKDEIKEIESASEDAFDGLIDNIRRGENALDSLRGFAFDVLSGIQDSIMQSALSSIGGAVKGSSIFKTATSALENIIPKFQTGGSFVVGGAGGTDSQMVQFRASPREKVTITTPEQQRQMANEGGQVGAVVNQTINVSTGVSQTVRAEIQSFLPQFERIAVSSVRDATARGKI